MKDAWNQLETDVSQCRLCPRLRAHCENVAREKKREFREWSYWGKPVSGFGDPHAALWILGLAPAAHGANRTGRMFTGDSSGNWLYDALHRHGFANQAESVSRDDGMELRSAFISAAGRCAPPENKPTREELSHCERYLDTEWELLTRRKLILALGSIAFTSAWSLMSRRGVMMPAKRPDFRHGELHDWGGNAVLTSYHPSRQNTQTRRLTIEMWDTVFTRATALVS